MYPFSTKEMMACKVAENPASLCSSPYLQVSQRERGEIIKHPAFFRRKNNKDIYIIVLKSLGSRYADLEYIGFPE